MTSSEYAIRYLLYQFPDLRKKKVREGLSAFVYSEERKRLATWEVEGDVARLEARDRADAAAQYLKDIAAGIEAVNEIHPEEPEAR